MSFLHELINSITDDELKEQLHERVDLVKHKLLFTEKVPLACLTATQQPQEALDYLIGIAGGERVSDPGLARVILYFEYKTGIPDLMQSAVPGLSDQWPAVRYNRVYLLDDTLALLREASDLVARLEDIAEMLHPGYFVFGNEGKTWISYNTL